ncbi:oligosaccharide flippase family protein [Marinomonas polaris]|uniref:oligosaccharide flippase family protein n=1 Tax=Marinomonas polaris TaxID=293552 RepID=UPI003F9B7880
MNNAVRLSFISNILVGAVQFIQGILLAKSLGIVNYGELAYINLFLAMVFTFSDFGFNNFFVNRKNIRPSIMLFFYISCSISVSILSLFILFYWTNIIKYSGMYIPFLYVLIMSFSSFFVVFFQKNNRVDLIAITESLSFFISFTYFLFYFIYSDISLAGVYFDSLLMMSFIRLVMFFVFFRFFGFKLFKKNDGAKRILFHLWMYVSVAYRFSIFQCLERISSYSNLRIEHFLISYFSTPIIFGVYMFCWNLVIQPSTKILPAFTRVAYPLLCVYSKSDAKILLQNLYAATIYLGLPIFFGLLLTTNALFSIFFDDTWSSYSYILLVLSFVYFLRYNSEIINCRFLSMGKYYYSFFFTFFITFLNSSLLLISFLYFDSFLPALVFSGFLVFSFKFFILKGVMEFDIKSLVLPYIIGVSSFIPSFITFNVFGYYVNSFFGIILFALFSVFSYAFLLFCFSKSRFIDIKVFKF